MRGIIALLIHNGIDNLVAQAQGKEHPGDQEPICSGIVCLVLCVGWGTKVPSQLSCLAGGASGAASSPGPNIWVPPGLTFLKMCIQFTWDGLFVVSCPLHSFVWILSQLLLADISRWKAAPLAAHSCSLVPHWSLSFCPCPCLHCLLLVVVVLLLPLSPLVLLQLLCWSPDSWQSFLLLPLEMQPLFPGCMQPWLVELAQSLPLQTRNSSVTETSHIMEGVFVSPHGKAEPILPDEVNGWSFVNDRVSSISQTALCSGCSPSMLSGKCGLQGQSTLLNSLRP